MRGRTIHKPKTTGTPVPNDEAADWGWDSMKFFAALIRACFYGAALAMLVRLCGTTWVWLTSSSVRTDEHTHAYIFRGKGRDDIQYVLSH